MDKQTAFILPFKDISIEDVPLVGGKNAALGEMFTGLTSKGIRVPGGFAVTAHAYRVFLRENNLEEKIKRALSGLNTRSLANLQSRGKAARALLLSAKMPDELADAIIKAYQDMGAKSVAVRSSATAEDLPGASFAGQQETYLNISGTKDVLEQVKKCFASLFTDRAISYREDKGFSHSDVSLSVGIQHMVRSDKASSGVMFTVDTETGFKNVIVINGSYGLGEMIVQGKVTPDEFLVHKPLLSNASVKPLIGRNLGAKDRKMIYAGRGAKVVSVSVREQNAFCLTDEEALTLARWGAEIESYFSAKHNRYQPMDIEWAKDGVTGELFVVQARPETVHAIAEKNIYKEYRLQAKGRALATGAAVGSKIASGRVRVIKDAKHIGAFRKGEVLVTEITDPDWEPIMKIASAIVTDKGGRTSHAAIVSRELGIPAIVGAKNATHALKNGQAVTVDCSSGTAGIVYEGALPFTVAEHKLDEIPKTKTKVMVNIGSPEEAFRNHWLPVEGVGLGRLEFIIGAHLQVHPMALVMFHKLARMRDAKTKRIVRRVEELTRGYKDKAHYYVDELAEGIAKIASAFWPHDVIIRFSDFKTNEYRTLIGGDLFEPEEANPMLGWRGASRYYDPKFKEAFGLECAAIVKTRQAMGLTNVVPMVPFCRTPEEGKNVRSIMEKHGLSKQKDPDLKVYVMCEIPSNVLRADEFLDVFDGMSIGSNDLTQLALGLDRDAGTLSHIGNENDPAVKELVRAAITACKKRGKYIGICGQGPSDYPDFAAFLVKQGIGSISLNPDSVIKTLPRIAQEENKI